jgi:diacylglycerol kinase family enzyme
VETELCERLRPHVAARSAPLVPFAVIPLGTANNFARALGIADDLTRRVRRWRRARPILLDLGMVTVRRRSRPFVEGVGGGLLAAAISQGRAEVEDRSNGRGDETRLALELLARLTMEKEPQRWEIELDGKDVSGDYIAVEALSIGLVGPNVSLAPCVDATDGRLDLVAVDADSRRAVLRQLDDRLHGRSPRPGRLTRRQFRRARLHPPHGAPFHVDDRSRPWHGKKLSVTIEIVVRPAAVPMVR